MTTRTTQHVICNDSQGTHRLVYQQWGDPTNPRVLICVHGLTRTSRDFDKLANKLSHDYRVICPDVAGRGESEWLSNPEDYNYSIYATDMLTLLTHLQIPTVDWVGTSMGGVIGMTIAAQPNSPIRRMVLNDIGAFVPKLALSYIASYLTLPPPHFTTMAEVERHVRFMYAPFGRLPDEQWRHLAEHSVKSVPEGGYRLTFDPEIALPFRDMEKITDVELWPMWEAIKCPILLLHGELSQLLLPETIAHMQTTRPDMQVIHFPDRGHAPTLMDDEQITIVRNWLLNHRPAEII